MSFKAQWNSKVVALVILGAFILSFNLGYQNLAAQTKAPLRSHAHGAAELDVAIEGKTLEIELTAPSTDIIGFEHAPKTDLEKRILAQVKDLFMKSFEIVSLSKEAKCKLLERKVTFEAENHTERHTQVDEDETDEQEEHEEHSEFKVKLTYSCLEPKKLLGADVRVFERFPTLQKIRAQVVNEDKQLSETLTPKKSILNINAAK